MNKDEKTRKYNERMRQGSFVRNSMARSKAEKRMRKDVKRQAKQDAYKKAQRNHKGGEDE